MKVIVLLLTCLAAVTSAVSLWNNKDLRSTSSNILINRPTTDEFGYKDTLYGARNKRNSPLKTRTLTAPGLSLTPTNLKKGKTAKNQPLLRKGEYMCGDKICKLQPGIIPCKDHLCQYPVL